ncbi:histone acetyltransferase HAC1 [Cucumis melo var. makuwa]|uniref:Histone acetyltransferase HAC1 n=1 Tax=Cucumis melo var. makuwa TaxID=1194695 RepID=A0A5A7SX15_CUCMM|nr:histone acetyltransferase HAC1 [Cucumis melo var. makuwa]TYK02800.1 histone acetyltransferase HAC1 [Cucumis melo var. makuwa]
MSSGYQQSPSFLVGSGGVISSAGAHRITSQMISTPGFRLSQVQLQKQHIGSQNSRILQNLGSQMGSGIRSSLQQKSYGFTNGSVNGSLGLKGSNVQLLKESRREALRVLSL